MKHTYLRSIAMSALMLIFAAIPAFAQHNSQVRCEPYDGVTNIRPIEKMISPKGNVTYYRLEGYATDDEYEIARYSYKGAKLVCVYETVTGEYQLYDSVRYNNKGQLVRLDGYQWLNNQWKHVYYVEYDYNEQGLIASRTNYNNFGSWEKGGIYNYTYNADGQITLSELLMYDYQAGADKVYARTEYVYQGGRLMQELCSMYDYDMMAITDYERIDYVYNGDKVIRKDNYMYEGGTYVYDGCENFIYDPNGNCLERNVANRFDQTVDRRVYTFDSRLLSETLMPWHPEIERPYTYTNKNIYTTEQWYTVDMDNVLQYVCDYDFDYSDHVGIEEVEQGTVSVYPNPASDQLNVTLSNSEPTEIAIYNAVGQVVLKKTISSQATISLKDLPAGSYIIKSPAFAAQTFIIAR